MATTKRFGNDWVRDGLAFLWSAFAMVFCFCTTFYPIPENNIRIVDTTHTFLLSTIIAAVIYYYFGSSKDKAQAGAAPVGPEPQTVTNTKEVTVTTKETAPQAEEGEKKG